MAFPKLGHTEVSELQSQPQQALPTPGPRAPGRLPQQGKAQLITTTHCQQELHSPLGNQSKHADVFCQDQANPILSFQIQQITVSLRKISCSLPLNIASSKCFNYKLDRHKRQKTFI